ncbi:Uncharacterised protein [Mycobacteroides abscessus subsp. abscessus]|nr:Uncharacterised protein [Mycobacteroides abscessus subsp. abscessus]
MDELAPGEGTVDDVREHVLHRSHTEHDLTACGFHRLHGVLAYVLLERTGNSVARRRSWPRRASSLECGHRGLTIERIEYPRATRPRAG